jgi:hypothetical protein
VRTRYKITFTTCQWTGIAFLGGQVYSPGRRLAPSLEFVGAVVGSGGPPIV